MAQMSNPGYKIHPNFAKAFGMHPMDEKEPEHMPQEGPMHEGNVMHPSADGQHASGMHPKIAMLIKKLSPMQEEEPEEEGQFSPSRMEAGME